MYKWKWKWLHQHWQMFCGSLTKRTAIFVSFITVASLVVLVLSIVLLPCLEHKAPQVLPSEASEVSPAPVESDIAAAAHQASPAKRDGAVAATGVTLRVLRLPDVTPTVPQVDIRDPAQATLNTSETQSPTQPSTVPKTLQIVTSLPETYAKIPDLLTPQLTPEVPSAVSSGRAPESATDRQLTKMMANAASTESVVSSVLPSPAATGQPAFHATQVTVQQTKMIAKEPLLVGENPPTAVVPPKTRTLMATVARGDSLSSLFSQFDLSQSDLALMLKTNKQHRHHLSRLFPKQKLEIVVNEANRLEKLVLHLDPVEALHLSRSGERFSAEVVKQPLTWHQAIAKGNINRMFYEDARKAGVSLVLIEQFIDILGWDIDFSRDVREGDQFTLIYSEPYVKQQRVGSGHILALEFINRGKPLRAVRYAFPDRHAQYFTPDGFSMRRTFLRSPVQFSRISSRFNLKRRHPVLHKVRAHRGVDYAASRGTPVKATADGRIIFVGRNGGYGRTIEIKHGASYTTLYAHLLRYKKGLQSGKRVRQGDTIGYVGKSGLATGYHLHYEFRINGVHQDPLNFDFPKGDPIEGSIKENFVATTRTLIDLLDNTPRLAALNQ